MDAQEFVNLFAEERESLMSYYFESKLINQESALVAILIQKLGLNQKQIAQLKDIIKRVLNDTHYSILCALDGTTNFGGKNCRQQYYKLYIDGEEDKPIYDFGELQVEAGEVFEEECRNITLDKKY